MLLKRYFCLSTIFIVSFLILSSKASAADFNPNLIISDEEIMNTETMDLADIQSFLASKGGFLASYSCPNASGVTKTAAEIIYDAAVNNYDCDGVENSENFTEAQKRAVCKKIYINPQFLLVLLQKEQSLIEDSAPTQSSLDWATGYGCPDGQACNPRWKGFGKQVNSAALQFYDYIVNPQYYTYKAGNSYTLSNTGDKPSTLVTPLSNATAALYNYTPHVYNGNYNFWKLWLRYFTKLYPNNTLLQVKGNATVWLVQNGKRRPFMTKGALTSRYDINKIVYVSQKDLEKYPEGDPIKFPQYSLVKSPRGTVFLIVDDKRRGFTSQEALRKIGVNPEEVMNASWEDINLYAEGEPITPDTAYPTGALLQDKKTGGVYYVSDGTKAPIWDRVLLKTKFKYKVITQVDPKKLESYKTVEPAIFNDGELLKSNSSPAVYVIDNKFKRPFVSGDVFEKLGYKWKNIIIVPDKILDLYPTGQPMDEIFVEDDNQIASSTPMVDEMTGSSTSAIASSTQSSASTTSELNEELEDIINPGN